MLLNYLILSIRKISRDFVYTSINIAGFACSLSCCFVLGLYIVTELSYDSFHEKGEQVFRYIPQSSEDGELKMQTWTPTGLAPLIANSFKSEVEEVTRFTSYEQNPMATFNDRSFNVKDIYLADSSFFKIFSFRLLRGNKSTVLARPLTMVISESVAKNNFPGEDPVGKIIRLQNKHDIEITGVFEDVPTNSHLKFSSLMSFNSLEKLNPEWDSPLNEFRSWNYSTYLLINKNVNIAELTEKVNDVLYNVLSNGGKRPSGDVSDWLQPLHKIRFTQGIKGDEVTTNINYVYSAISLCIIIVLMASFNFMNLAIAMAMKRAKEIGLRKTLGAFKSQLVGQFLGDAFIQVFFSFTIAVVLIILFLPLTRNYLGLEFIELSNTEFILSIIVFIIVTTLLAGGYPAFYLSSLKPASALKGHYGHHEKSLLKSTLLTFQFGATMFLLMCSIVILLQLRFIEKKDLGFKKDNIITFFATREIKEIGKFETFRQSLLENPGVKDVTISNNRLGKLQGYWRYNFPNKEVEGNISVTTLIVYDGNYFDFMEMRMKEGRRFSSEFPTDANNAFMVNEAFVSSYGLENPVGTELQVRGDSIRRGMIIGVVKDFYFQPLHNEVSPLIIRMDERNAWLVSVKLESNNLPNSIATIESIWKKYSGGAPFEFQFLDDYLKVNYINEKRATSLIISLTFFAIIIAGLGLLGITAFMAMQRRKEIGIRRVMGSSMIQVIMLFTREVSGLLLVSFIITVPLAFIASEKWLEGFAYKIELNPMIFLIAGIAVYLIGLAIVSFQAAKAANENPAQILQGE